MTNGEVAEVFERIAGLLEMKGEKSFTVRAYQRAARTINRLPSEAADMIARGEDLTAVPDIGRAIADKTAELVDTGRLDFLDRLLAEFPPGIPALMDVPGLGPKTTLRIWKELNVTDLDQLEAAIETGALASLPRMGRKSAENILRAVRYSRSKSGRLPISRALATARQLTGALVERCPDGINVIPCGGIRRFEEEVDEIVLVGVTSSPGIVLDAFSTLSGVANVVARQDTNATVELESGVNVTLSVVAPESKGAAILNLTGSSDHISLLSQRAAELGLKLSQRGLADRSSGAPETFPDEQSLYDRLGLPYMPPEVRQGRDEIAVALSGDIARLVDLYDIKGDLHAHTDWSDGRDPMIAMVQEAKNRGLEYIAITDHSSGRGIANGLSPERLLAHMSQVKEVEQEIGGIRVLRGTEMDIRADGTLDYSDDLLQQLDWVVASVHSAMGQDSTTMTDRIIAAMKNPHVSAIGHLSTRLIGDRKPIEADYDAVFRAAAVTGTALEINGSLERLDLKDLHVERALEFGAMLIISTDAHTTESLDNLDHGVRVARRALCKPVRILNTMPADEFDSWLRLDKTGRTVRLSAND
ncbi:MAG: DNA polymerase III [Chloroflexi bacterium]|nr:DNA polymerase III [Chloroflexota bacterium]